MGKAKKAKQAIKGVAGFTASAIKKAQSFLPGRTSAAQAVSFLSKKKGTRQTAKQKLKKAYERRAIRQIRQGNLGQARRSLRKKATVI